MSINKIMVVGAGLMGGGIAQVCAQAGIEVWLNDVSAKSLDKAITSIQWSLEKLVIWVAKPEKVGKLTILTNRKSNKFAEQIYDESF